MKQKIEKLRYSKTLIAVTVLVAAILYILLFFHFGQSAPVRTIVQQNENSDAQLLANAAQETTVTEQTLSDTQAQIYQLLSEAENSDNYTLYCEYQDHTYHLISMNEDQLQLQYDDTYYQLHSDGLYIKNQDWDLLSASDTGFYTASQELQTVFNLLSEYFAQMADQDITQYQTFTLNSEPFTGITEYNCNAIRITLNGYYQDVNLIISNIGTSYFE
ncbi:hypothetical protein [Butyrivibrio sp.]|uniref:hypothetical protein n=1 Tax=Butyrivibrio sp. TaxID=28121 RepID=UPI0025C69E9B|nr:hypothetical protein [Butyrivibrio sp.]MBQ9303168.1 hypothetical protein [Butyrivibrio sp.]